MLGTTLEVLSACEAVTAATVVRARLAVSFVAVEIKPSLVSVPVARCLHAWFVRGAHAIASGPKDSIKAEISAARHAVQRSESFTPAGNRPARMPSHHVEGETGTSASTSGNRSKPPAARIAAARSADSRGSGFELVRPRLRSVVRRLFGAVLQTCIAIVGVQHGGLGAVVERHATHGRAGSVATAMQVQCKCNLSGAFCASASTLLHVACFCQPFGNGSRLGRSFDPQDFHLLCNLFGYAVRGLTVGRGKVMAANRCKRSNHRN